MSLQTKTFIGLIILIGAATGAACYISSHKPMPKNSNAVHPAPMAPEVMTDKQTNDSLPLNADNAPFNSVGNEELKAKGRFGFLTSIIIDPDKNTAEVTFDEALWLTGDQAEKAAREKLGCGKATPPEECKTGSVLNNPYYIVNTIPKLFKLTADASTDIKLIDYKRTDGLGIKTGSFAELQEIIDRDKDNPIPAQRSYQPFWIIEEEGHISYIEEQYIP